MDRRHLPVSLLGAALALAIGIVSGATNAQQFRTQQQPQPPSYRSSPNSQPMPARPSGPASATSQPPQSAPAQVVPPAPSEQRRPQPLASSAASAQAATACMNDQKSASV